MNFYTEECTKEFRAGKKKEMACRWPLRRWRN